MPKQNSADLSEEEIRLVERLCYFKTAAEIAAELNIDEEAVLTATDYVRRAWYVGKDKIRKTDNSCRKNDLRYKVQAVMAKEGYVLR
jgi:hypothetical protein